MLGAEVVALSEVQTGSMQTVGKHIESDLSRYAYVLTRVKGSLLDVGCGHGIFLDRYEGGARAGVDIQARGEHDWPFHLADADALPFADASWDTVSAQEMLEHQPDEKVGVVLAELRRVMRERLLITVPFCERRLKSGHLQRFDAERVRTLFPDGRYTILDKGDRSFPWVLIEEDAPRR
jgi:SAM-dependent methyltransferase